MNHRHLRALAFVALVVVGAIAPTAVGSLLANEPQAPFKGGDDGLVIAAGGAPHIAVTGSGNISNAANGTGDGTVELNTTGGNITFTSSVRANATIALDDITGTWTNVSGIEARDTLLKVSPEDKQTVGAGGAADSLNISDTIAADDGQPDLAYSGTNGLTKLFIPGLTANAWYRLVDESGAVLITARTNDAGDLLVAVPSSSHTVSLQSGTPQAVAAQHTTDSDFSAATELTNVSVDGSGDSASVVINQSVLKVLDGFEDGNINEYTLDTGAATVETTQPFEGQRSVNISGGTILRTDSTVNTSTGDTMSVQVNRHTNSSVEFYFFVQDDSYTDADNIRGYELQVSTAGTPFLIHEPSSDILGSGDSNDIAENVYNEIEIAVNQTNAITVTTRDSNGQITEQFTVTNTSYSSGGVGFGQSFGTGGTDAHSYVDAYGALGAVDSGRYTSQNVSADAPTVAANVTAENASLNYTVEEWTGSQWQLVNSSNLTTTGNHTIDISAASNTKLRSNVTLEAQSGTTTAELHDETYLFDAAAPDPDNATATPSGGAKLQGQQVNLSILVTDADFGTAQGDSVDVEFQTQNPNQNSFSTETTNTITSNTTASHTITADIGGEWTWRVAVNDSYGNSVTSENFTFEVPANLSIRNESNVSEVIDTVNVTGKFYSDDEIVINDTVSGVLNLTGKPIPTEGNPLILVLEADGYHTRATVVESIYEQDNVYMLNDTGVVTTNEIRFTLDDTIGNFPASEAYLRVQRAINHSDLPDASNETTWTTIAGDRFGENGFTVDLESEERFRLVLKNGEGDTRVVGPFTPTTRETVTVQPESLGVNISDDGTPYIFNASLVNDTSTQAIEIAFSDAETDTTNLEVQICEQDTPTDCFNNFSAAGPLGEAGFTQQLNDSESRKNYIVTWSADRGGGSIGGEAIVGATRVEQIPELADVWRHSVAVLVAILTGGLFTAVNRDTGAIVTGLTLGGFWHFQWLPANAGGPIVIAIVLAVLYKGAKVQGGALPD